MKTFTAIILNIFYPGAGYLYLKDDFRKTIAKFLVFVWTMLIFGIIYQAIRNYVTGNLYLINTEFDPPFLAVAMWGFMTYDTFKLARSQNNNR